MAKHTTQTALAKKLGCTPQMISAWKLGKTGLSLKAALKWSKILGIDFETLMMAKKKNRAKLLGIK